MESRFWNIFEQKQFSPYFHKVFQLRIFFKIVRKLIYYEPTFQKMESRFWNISSTNNFYTIFRKYFSSEFFHKIVRELIYYEPTFQKMESRFCIRSTGSKSPTIGIYNSNISCQSWVRKIKHQNIYANLKNFILIHKIYEGQNRPRLAINTLI